jgi:hypothetical protein
MLRETENKDDCVLGRFCTIEPPSEAVDNLCHVGTLMEWILNSVVKLETRVHTTLGCLRRVSSRPNDAEPRDRQLRMPTALSSGNPATPERSA